MTCLLPIAQSHLPEHSLKIYLQHLELLFILQMAHNYIASCYHCTFSLHLNCSPCNPIHQETSSKLIIYSSFNMKYICHLHVSLSMGKLRGSLLFAHYYNCTCHIASQLSTYISVYLFKQ